MAEPAVVPLSLQLNLHRNCIKEQSFVPSNSQTRLPRKYFSRSCKTIQFSYWNSCKLHCRFASRKVHCLQESLTKCYCLGALVNADNLADSGWVPYVDQVLLMVSIFLTYIAGVIPSGKPLPDANKSPSNDFAVPENYSLSGSCSVKENDNEENLHFVWDIVKDKLLDSLYAMKQAIDLGNRVSGIDQYLALRRSNLIALAELPRMRWLLFSGSGKRWIMFLELQIWISQWFSHVSFKIPVSLCAWLGWKKSFALKTAVLRRHFFLRWSTN